MKTLANCNPKEFLVQTNKIRHFAEKWLSLTRIMEIRKEAPKLTDEMTKDEKEAAIKSQVKRNAMSILDSILDDYPDETAELLGMLCFVEPDDLENHSVAEFLGAFTEIIDSPEVVGFFISLMRLADLDISDSAKA